MDSHHNAQAQLLLRVHATCTGFLTAYADNPDSARDLLPDEVYDWMVTIAAAVTHTPAVFVTWPIVTAQLYGFAATYVMVTLREDVDVGMPLYIHKLMQMYYAGEIVKEVSSPGFVFWVCWFIIRSNKVVSTENSAVVTQEALTQEQLSLLYGILLEIIVEQVMKQKIKDGSFIQCEYTGPPLRYLPDRRELEKTMQVMDLASSFAILCQEITCRLLPPDANPMAFWYENQTALQFLETISDSQYHLGAVARSITEEYELFAELRIVAAVISFFVVCTFNLFRRIVEVRMNRAFLDTSIPTNRYPVILLHRRGTMGVLLPSGEVMLLDCPFLVIQTCLRHMIEVEQNEELKKSLIEYKLILKGKNVTEVRQILQTLQTEVQAHLSMHSKTPQAGHN